MQIYACKIYKLKSLKTILLSIKYLQSKQFGFKRQQNKLTLDLGGKNSVKYVLNFDNIFGLVFSSLLRSDTYLLIVRERNSCYANHRISTLFIPCTQN